MSEQIPGETFGSGGEIALLMHKVKR